jgi:hypothetical protein
VIANHYGSPFTGNILKTPKVYFEIIFVAEAKKGFPSGVSFQIETKFVHLPDIAVIEFRRAAL